jgi:hypothetical protein
MQVERVVNLTSQANWKKHGSDFGELVQKLLLGGVEVV